MLYLTGGKNFYYIMYVVLHVERIFILLCTLYLTGGKSAYYVSDNGSQISRAGRPSNEDLTVNVIRDILK